VGCWGFTRNRAGGGTGIPRNVEALKEQLKKLDRKRLVFIDEGNQKAIRADLLKEIANGGSLENQILFGTTELLQITWKLFICSNHLPTIRKKESTVYNRYHQIQFGSHFDRTGKREVEDEEKLLFKANVGLGDKLKTEFTREIIALMVEYATLYYTNLELYDEGIPPAPKEFQEAIEKTKMKNNPFAVWFEDTFEKVETAQISLDEVMRVSNSNNKRQLVRELKELGYNYEKDMSGLGMRMNYRTNKMVYVKGGFNGFRLIEAEDVGVVAFAEAMRG